MVEYFLRMAILLYYHDVDQTWRTTWTNHGRCIYPCLTKVAHAPITDEHVSVAHLLCHTGYPCIQALVGPTYKMALSHGLAKTLMQIMVAVTRSIGKTRQRWEKYITDTFGTMAAASRVAGDRHQFRRDIWAATS